MSYVSNFTRPLGTTLGLILLIIATGCAQQAPTPPPPEPAPPIAPDPIPAAELRTLLEQADQAIEREHLTFPKRGSALAIYQSILARDPQSEPAQRGLEVIVERYVKLSLDALERRQFATARSMLTRGRLILPDHPSIEPSERQIRLLEEANYRAVQLQPAQLQDDETLQAALDGVATVPKPYDLSRCRFKIWASSDAQGRRIYQLLTASAQQLNQSNVRVRAQMAVRRPAGIERTCFAPED